MVDFRNSLIPLLSEQIAPFRAGLNDCMSGGKWLANNHADLGINPEQIIIAGESGGGNLTPATGLKLKEEGNMTLVRGLYARCPCIAESGPFWKIRLRWKTMESFLFAQQSGAMAYGIEELEKRNYRAWPGFANEDQVKGRVPTMISVNECDPLKDEGINFYSLLLRAGVSARADRSGHDSRNRNFPFPCPDVSHEFANDIANFCETI